MHISCSEQNVSRTSRGVRFLVVTAACCAVFIALFAPAVVMAGDGIVKALPAGTQVDRLEWIDGLAQIDLTLPADVNPTTLSDGQIEAIYAALADAVDPDRESLGLVVRGRAGVGGDYAPLSSGPAVAAEQPERETDTVAEAQPLTPAGQEATTSLGGPTAHGGTQPAGALSGVIVYAAAGHGWTASSSAWYLQRPLMEDMNEDYGNVDQLHYFVQYLYNAGATVVPFRPVGWQTIEVVLDNDDPGVTYTGTWGNSTAGAEYYENGVTASGVPYRYATAEATESATARYTPTIPTTDFYPVYCWTRDDDDCVRQTYRVAHSGGVAEVVIDHRMVGKGWIWLGNYYLLAGTDNYVEITNASPDTGVVIADAIRFGNGMGDIVRPGPGTISGYAREEECAKYWAQSEAGNNAVGMPSSIWGNSGDDGSDNVGTSARWAAAMNRQSYNNDRWRRAYIEYHTNATGNHLAQGTISLISSSAPTTNQEAFATITGEKMEADMLQLDDEFEYPWGDRPTNIYAGGYGAISTYNNDNEFDATLIEVAFHDQPEDAANLLNPTVRAAVARSTVQGLTIFLNSLSGSTVPLAFAPSPPEDVSAVHDGAGNVIVSWSTPPSGGALGDPATGYKVYRSPNGYGFDNGTAVGDVLTTTLTDIPANTTVYLRVAATNAGGESMPTEAMAVCVPSNRWARVLLVNGFDRVARIEDPTETIPLGPQKRPLWRQVNSFDYTVQHGSAIAAAGIGFDSSSNEAVADEMVSLAAYEAVVWILGEEGDADVTFSATEQAVVTAFLNGGGSIFVSGASIGTDLDLQGNGQAFFENVLGANCLSSFSSSNAVEGAVGTFLAGVAQTPFGLAGVAPYWVQAPDVIGPQPGAVTVINYPGRIKKSAGVAYDTGVYKAVTFGFPFESLHSDAVRDQVMASILDYLLECAADLDGDGDVDLADFGIFAGCFNGPNRIPVGSNCGPADLDSDTDVDLADFGMFSACFNGPNRPAACN
ncbi:MAG: fibronectin type III domain-containing protein [Phycisphaerae bacterium]|nr:fibronectin type III domain-containing protein [Phycisphaerae bacterium]